MNEYLFTICVKAPTMKEAQIVIAERIDHDEDYGFEYRIHAAEQEPQCGQNQRHHQIP